MPIILCVEDEDVLRDDLADELRHAGHQVLVARNGKEALHVLGSAVPDLILCDLSMPVMNGSELLSTLKGIPHLANVPFVFTSACDEIAHPASDYVAFLRKPLDFNALLDFIQRTLSDGAGSGA